MTQIKSQVVEIGSNTLLLMKVNRVEGKTKLSLKVSPEMEGLFKKEQKRESNIYKIDGRKLSFYEWDDNEHNYERVMSNVELNTYGREFLRSGEFNFSVLRTVGISEGVDIEIDKLISEETLTEWSKNLKDFTVKLYKNFLKPIEITVTIEKREVC